ncbi:MAG TPA: methionyl-tRNA formyltransferase [Longimicrobium sp.]|nr:methionyl-tRNA formyltransferase [Longimicrobium sp.]
MSWHCLRVIAELCRTHGDELVAVFNLPPEAGASHSAYVEFHGLANEFGFPEHATRNLGSPENLELLHGLRLDVLFIIGWHRIVPQAVIDSARYCLGLHSSLLPRNRGSSPINWAIIHGEREGGMTLFHLAASVDSGDIVAQKAFPIGPDDTCKDVYDRATVASVELLRENWAALREGNVARIPQDEAAATLNPRRKPQDGEIDWNRSAQELQDWVRALTHPYPGAFTTLRGKKLLVWQARAVDEPCDAPPGVVISTHNHVRVATGRGVLDLGVLQFVGERECPAPVFDSVYGLRPGERIAEPGTATQAGD